MTGRRLHEHIGHGLYELGRFLVAQCPTPEWRELVAQWLEAAHERGYVFEETVDRNGRGRTDTRSTRMTVYLPLDDGTRVQLCSVLVRDLVDSNGQPIDAQEDARTLLLQQGIGIPDSPAGIDGA